MATQGAGSVDLADAFIARDNYAGATALLLRDVVTLLGTLAAQNRWAYLPGMTEASHQRVDRVTGAVETLEYHTELDTATGNYIGYYTWEPVETREARS